jgi:hypothetical protein
MLVGMTATPGLSEFQQKLVAEAAEAFARQILATSNSDSAIHNVVVPAVREPGRTVPPVSRQTQVARQTDVPRSSDVTTAGVTVQGSTHGDIAIGAGSVHNHNVAQNQSTESGLAIAAKKKGPECFRCHKTGHCINDCKTYLCDCCQSADHAT